MGASGYRMDTKGGSSGRETTTEEAEILLVHEHFWQSYARRDLDSRFSVCADDITFFGTGLHERAVGKAQYRAMNEKGVEQYPDAFTIDHIWLEVRLWGDVAWVEGDTFWIMGQGGASTRDIVRQTTILKRINGKWWVAHVHGSDPDYRLREGEYITHGNIHARNKELEREVLMRTEELRREKQRSEELLLNILPEEVAEELKAKGEADAKLIDQVTVLFTDFKGFTAMSEKVTPKELVHDLHECFSAFDRIMAKHGIEKIKTIGDAYMAAGGLPTPNTTHATDVIQAAFEMRDFIAEGKARKATAGLPYFEVRIGIHTGPVVAGIVGVKKFQYDIWGDTVNTASRMESSGEVGQVNISEATYALVKDEPGLTFTPRGKVQAKGKGEMEMYFVASKR
ncbi:MAG: nuclear transport factor 2 family protein [Flavobacteriales bacterium]|jgi:class 3 adenylate cyclase/ketosteroid isomerase-like protein|nr:nuclear transport factor 2 family protein [Flavobacteriales bacterium]